MKKYKIVKIGQSDNIHAHISKFGDSKDFFVGYSYGDPEVDRRFTLYQNNDKLYPGLVEISTSVVQRIEENLLYTTYSIYSFEEL